jgi:hypothetical protein
MYFVPMLMEEKIFLNKSPGEERSQTFLISHFIGMSSSLCLT